MGCAVSAGGAGNDSLDGQSGNDTIVARDSQRDTVGGGTGSDKAQVDNSASVKDLCTDVETLLQ